MNESESPLGPENEEISREFNERRRRQIIQQMEDEELERIFDMKQEEIRAAKEQGIISRHILEDARWEKEFAPLFKKYLPIVPLPEIFGRKLRNLVLGEVAKTLKPTSPDSTTPAAEPQQPDVPPKENPSTSEDPNQPTE